MKNNKKRGKNLEIRWSLRTLVKNLLPGRFRSKQAWSKGIVFTNRGRFVPGRDSLSSIDWKTMFMSRPLSNFRDKTRNITTVFLVDISPSMLFSSERSSKKDIADFLLGMANASAKSGNKVGLLAFSYEIKKFQPVICKPTNTQKTLNWIINYDPAAEKEANRSTSLKPALQKLINLNIGRSLIFILSDFNFNCDYEQELRAINGSNSIIPIVLNDPEDDIPAVRGAYFVAQDAETGRVKYLRHLKKNRCCLDLFKNLKISCLKLNTGQNNAEITKKLVKFFNARRF